MSVHDGHRARMRERFRKEGLEGFAPHEVLELLLFYSRPRGDVNPLAHALLETFGTLKGVLEASPEQLMKVKGIGEETATFLAMMLPVFRRYSACVTEETRCIRDRASAIQYCRALLSGWRTERFYVVCLNAELHLLGVRLIAEGSLNEVPAYPRLVVETALNLNAQYVLLCHNHPSGNCAPSEEDIGVTRELSRLLRGMDITLLDHIIVAGESARSLSLYLEAPEGEKAQGAPRSLIPTDGKSTLIPGKEKRRKPKGKNDETA